MRDRRLHEVQLNHESELSRVKNECNDLRNQLALLRSETDKQRSDLANRDSIINRLESELVSHQRETDRFRESHSSEVNRLKIDHDADLRRFHDLERELRNRNAECEKRLKYVDEDNIRLKLEYDRMKDLLSGNISKVISQTFGDSDGRMSPKKGMN